MSNFGECDRIATSGLVMSGEVPRINQELQHIGQEKEEIIGLKKQQKGKATVGQKTGKKKRLATKP